MENITRKESTEIKHIQHAFQENNQKQHQFQKTKRKSSFNLIWKRVQVYPHYVRILFINYALTNQD